MSDAFPLLQRITNEAGSLLHANYVTWNELPHDVVSFVLTFENMELTVTARDDDTVELIQRGVETNSEYSVHNGDESPWSEAIGKPIRWAWLMTNQQGYQDGIQIEFARNVSEPSTIIQLVAVSSALRLFRMQEKQADAAAETHGIGLID